MDKKIIEASELPENEKIYLRKDSMGWKIIAPVKDPETGKINWLNLLLGGKRNAVFLLVVMLIIALAYFGVNEIISGYEAMLAECMFNPFSS